MGHLALVGYLFSVGRVELGGREGEEEQEGREGMEGEEREGKIVPYAHPP